MKLLVSVLTMLLFCATAWTQSTSENPVVVNSREGKWQHDSDDPPGGESLILRMDRKTGAMEFFARYPAGFAFKQHAHKANERFMLMEGKAVIEIGDAKTTIDPGGFAYFPTGQTHRISCVSSTACMWYLAWDGKP